MDIKNKNIMKVFWIVNFIPTDLVKQFNSRNEVSGGWIKGMCDLITEYNDIDLVFIFKIKNKNNISGESPANRYRYIGIPTHNFRIGIEKILETEKPDIIHIWGAEFLTALHTIDAAKDVGMRGKTIVSIQGLASEIKRYVKIGLPSSVMRGCTFYEFIRKCSLNHMIRSYEKRSDAEIQVLKEAGYLLGRTEWDYACVEQYNLEKKYRRLNENLRKSFYQNRWSYDNCEKHSLFVSRGDSPIKGFHILLEAFSLVVSKYPDAKLYVAGDKPFNDNENLILFFKKTKYGQYIKREIKKRKLDGKIIFLGALDEQRMLETYLKTNVFVLPSTIENSPNSLGEAMLLGMPCVVSDVGGVRSMLTHEQEGFIYQCDSPALLAHYICLFFSDKDLSETCGKNAMNRAKQTHDRDVNAKHLIDIYMSIRDCNM